MLFIVLIFFFYNFGIDWAALETERMSESMNEWVEMHSACSHTRAHMAENKFHLMSAWKGLGHRAWFCSEKHKRYHTTISFSFRSFLQHEITLRNTKRAFSLGPHWKVCSINRRKFQVRWRLTMGQIQLLSCAVAQAFQEKRDMLFVSATHQCQCYPTRLCQETRTNQELPACPSEIKLTRNTWPPQQLPRSK